MCPAGLSAQLESHFNIHLHSHRFAVCGRGGELRLLYGINRILLKFPVRGADRLDVVHATLLVDRTATATLPFSWAFPVASWYWDQEYEQALEVGCLECDFRALL